MTIDPGLVKKWFGYNRKERRASGILLIIIFALLLVRISLPEKTMELEDITASQIAITGAEKQSAESFIFDPNTASFDTLIRLGLEEKEARTLISYRTKGGRFRQPSDIRRLYNLEEEKAEALIPLIVIEQDTYIKPGTDTKQDTSRRNFSRREPPIDLNRCDSAMLESLPGIGPVLSVRIIKYRNLLGGFASVSQLREVYGLSPETFEFIKDRVTADPSVVRKLDLNTAEYRSLSRFPYIEDYEAAAIMKYRELEGKISGLEELVANKIISEEKAGKIRPYLEFE